MAEAKQTKANQTDANQTDQLRIRYGFWVVIVGFLLVGVIAVAAVLKWNTAGDVTAIIGSVTGVVGTVVGAFFGVHVGSAGKEKAEAARDQADDEAQTFAGLLSPAQFKKAKQYLKKG
jgi:hypothetical protein